MRQHEVRTTEHNHTPSSKARQPGRHKSNQIPRGRDQRTNWARAPHGTNRRGKGSNNRQGGEPTTAKQTRQTQRGPTTHRKEHDNHRKTPAIAQAETPTRQNHKHREATHERKQNTRPRTQDGRESTARINPAPEKPPNLKKGATRGQNPTEARKKGPHHTAASGSKTQSGAQRTRAQETKAKPKQNRGRREKEGEGRYVRLRVVYSR